MKTSLYSFTAVCCLAFAASAQVKTQQLPAKNPVGGPVPNGGTSFLAVGGSDDCANASTADAITGPGTYAVTNVGATNGAPDATGGCVNTQLDVWFYYTAATAGRTTVATCGGTTADTVLTVWPDNAAGACPTGTTAVGCSDDSCGVQSSVTFCAAAGQTFFIQLGAFGAATTYTGTFTVTEVPLVEVGNDSCATPLALAAGDTVQAFDNTAMSTGCQGQTEALCLAFGTTAMSKDSWYTWTPTVSGPVTVSTCGLLLNPPGNTFDSRIAVYDGAGCPSAAAIACNDDAAAPTCAAPQGLASTLTFTAVCGQSYTIQVAQFATAATTNLVGSFSITQDPLGTPCVTGPTEFCFGDNLDPNVTNSCPCANYGAAGRGCASSFNAAGAKLSASGSVALDTVVLTADGVNTTGNVIYMRGNADNVVGTVFGDGVRCVDGSLIRRTKPISTPNQATFPAPADTVTLSTGWGAANNTPPGSAITAYYMAYYRNAAAAFCPPETFNGTNGIEITW